MVRLAGGKNIVVDSKVSLAAYLEAAEAADDDVRRARLDAHARHLREHVDRLAAKAYWAALSPAPEFVVLFIPGEAFLAPALEHDPGLLEHAMARRVHIATPTTLVTMLRTAQYAWQQDALSENARAVFDLGRELYDRLSGLGRHVDGLGRALSRAVTAYNQTVGSLESRVLVSARRLNELGVIDAELDPPRPVEDTVRPLSAPELDQRRAGAGAGPSRGATTGRPTAADAGARPAREGNRSRPATRRCPVKAVARRAELAGRPGGRPPGPRGCRRRHGALASGRSSHQPGDQAASTSGRASHAPACAGPRRRHDPAGSRPQSAAAAGGGRGPGRQPRPRREPAPDPGAAADRTRRGAGHVSVCSPAR